MKTTKVTITALKAPWPEGAQVGHVVAFLGEPSPWTLGKCKPAPEDTEPDFTYEPAPPANVGAVVDGGLTITPVQQRELTDRFEALERERSDLIEQVDLQRQSNQQLVESLEASVKDADSLREQLAASVQLASTEKARADELQAKLTAAEKAVADAAAPKGTKK